MNTTPDPATVSATSKPRRTRRRRITAEKAYAIAEKQLKVAQAARQKALEQIESSKREESERQGERLVTAIIRQMNHSTREAIMAMIGDEATEDQQPLLHAWQASLS